MTNQSFVDEIAQAAKNSLYYTARGDKLESQSLLCSTQSKLCDSTKFNRHYTDLMIFVGAGLVPAPIVGKHKALPLQNVNDFLIGINSNVGPRAGYAFTLGLGGMIHAT